MLPDRCTVQENGRQCPNPPAFVISVAVGSDEFMIGVTCDRHRAGVSEKVRSLQREGRIPKGKVNLEALKAVGTDCVRGGGGCGDDLIRIG